MDNDMFLTFQPKTKHEVAARVIAKPLIRFVINSHFYCLLMSSKI